MGNPVASQEGEVRGGVLGAFDPVLGHFKVALAGQRELVGTGQRVGPSSCGGVGSQTRGSTSEQGE